MEKEFVPYELALKLKSLGFSMSYPIGGYQSGSVFYYEKGKLYYDGRPMYSSDSHEGQIVAPLYQQAFRWFREKHQIFPEVLTDCTTEPKFVYTYNTFYGNPKDLTEQEWGWENNIGQYSDLYRTYEEAELACLEKLIQIVENKSE